VVGRRTQRRIDVRPLLVAIVVAASLAFFYLSQSTQVAATGYEIDALEARLAEARADQQQLILAIGQARSPAEITHRAERRLGLIPLDQGAVTYATAPGDPSN
jgi:cell division protein FtsL